MMKNANVGSKRSFMKCVGAAKRIDGLRVQTEDERASIVLDFFKIRPQIVDGKPVYTKEQNEQMAYSNRRLRELEVRLSELNRLDSVYSPMKTFFRYSFGI